jgi:hypothetical protein
VQRTFIATVKPGALSPNDKGAWKEFLTPLVGKTVQVTIATLAQVRRNRANRYWRGVVVEYFREVWSQKYRKPLGLPEYTSDEAHYALVSALRECRIDAQGVKIIPPTRTMTVAEFAELTADAKKMAYEDYGSILPEPNEVDE